MNIHCVFDLGLNNSQKVKFDKWHTFNTFIKLILRKHSTWNVSLIFLELFFKFVSEDSDADEPIWFVRDVYFSWKLSEMIFLIFAKLYIGLHYCNSSSILFRRDKYSGVSLIQTLAFPREFFRNRLYDFWLF